MKASTALLSPSDSSTSLRALVASVLRLVHLDLVDFTRGFRELLVSIGSDR